MNFGFDGVIPSEVVRPESAADVAAMLADCHARGVSVVPWGGGTRMHIGNVPKRYDVAMDVTALNQNIEHVPGDMTVVCDAGVQIGYIEAQLATSDQRLPFAVPSPALATIGGSIASNAPSRLRPRFGGIRDWIIGIGVVLADGTPTKSGGRVVKNVQGFDLHRLHTGAYGTLGVITSVALKLVPSPENTRTVAMWFDRYNTTANAALEVANLNLTYEAIRIFSGARAIGAIRELAALRHMDADGESDLNGHLMLAQVSGSPAVLRRQVDELTGLAGTIPASGYEALTGNVETEFWDFVEEGDQNAVVEVRIASKPSDSVMLINRLRQWLGSRSASAASSSVIDVGFGSLLFSVEGIDEADAQAFANEAIRFARSVGGSAMIERCPLSVKEQIDVFGIDASSSQIMKNMKQQFDAAGILNPGRFAFRI